jgi:hypothetical protein
MKTMLKVGLVIGVLCAGWQVVMVSAGWLTNPSTFRLFYLVILIQIAVLFWGLKQTAPQKGYVGQLLAGTGASLVAGVFLFAYSLILTTVLFPNLIAQMKSLQTQELQNAGRSREQIEAMLALQTPLIQAAQGFLGTVVTGFLASLILALFLRRK